MHHWSSESKYQKENLKEVLSPNNPNKIVFMGDSITEFWSTINPDFFEGKPYINRGISGQTTPQMVARFKADVIALQPKIVVLLAGINDIAGNTGPSTLTMITDNLFAMAEIARTNGIRVILCAVLPAFDFPWRPNQHPIPKIIALNQSIYAYAKTNQIEYVDYYSAMVNEQKGLQAHFSNDGVHPNTKGYRVMEPLVEKAITRVLELN
ncbi:SGNH/GDSL hydrolase family protein [Flavobacterium restrictum]|nr:SGNH/GDSL hydrolase family protein [Flavobacterium restrictum]